ncbi:hypothetical protein GGG16DRAFT_106713, partial [Schizophyllum commune]
ALNNTPLTQFQNGEATLDEYIKPVVRLLSAIVKPDSHIYPLVDPAQQSTTFEALRTNPCDETIHAALLHLWCSADLGRDPTERFLALLALHRSGDDEQLEIYETVARPWVLEDRPSSFSTVRSLQHYCSADSMLSGGTAKCLWLDAEQQRLTIDGQEIGLSHLRAMVGLAQKRVLHLLDELSLGVDYTVDTSQLTDSLNNTDTGYSVFSCPYIQARRAQFLEEWFPRATKFGIFPSKINPDAAYHFLRKVTELNGNLLLLLYLGSGGLARKTEIVNLLAVNISTHPRAFYRAGKCFLIVRSYSKTSHLHGHDKIIPVAPDLITSLGIFISHALYAPVCQYLSPVCMPGRVSQAVRAYHDLLFTNMGKPFTEGDFGRLLTSLGHEAGLTFKLGAQDMRHFFVEVIRVHLPQSLDTLEALVGSLAPSAQQMGHTLTTEYRHYGVSFQAVSGLHPTQLAVLTSTSFDWSLFLGLTPGNYTHLPLKEATMEHLPALLEKGIVKRPKPSSIATMRSLLEVLEAVAAKIDGTLTSTHPAILALQEKIDAMQSQFDRMEAKLDRIIAFFGPATTQAVLQASSSSSRPAPSGVQSIQPSCQHIRLCIRDPYSSTAARTSAVLRQQPSKLRNTSIEATVNLPQPTKPYATHWISSTRMTYSDDAPEDAEMQLPPANQLAATYGEPPPSDASRADDDPVPATRQLAASRAGIQSSYRSHSSPSPHVSPQGSQDSPSEWEPRPQDPVSDRPAAMEFIDDQGVKHISSSKLMQVPGYNHAYYKGFPHNTSKDMIHFVAKCLGESTATYRTHGQRAGLDTLLRCQSDAILVLPTAAGKTLMTVLPSMVEVGITIIIPPLRILVQQYRTNLARWKIPYALYNTEKSSNFEIYQPLPGQPHPNIVLVSAEAYAHDSFAQALLKQLSQHQMFIQRIVLDECHLALTQGHFRHNLLDLARLRLFPAQWVLLTGTAPPAVIPWLRDQFQLQANFHVVREMSDRKEIAYLIQPQVWVSWQSSGSLVLALIKTWRETNSKDARFIIFVRSVAEGLLASKALGIPFYYANNEANLAKARVTLVDHEMIWAQFMDDEVGRGIVGTPALTAGVDHPGVNLTVHLGSPSNMTDWVQETNRSGRAGQPSQAVIFRSECMPAPTTHPHRRRLPEEIITLTGHKEMAYVLYELAKLPWHDVTKCIRWHITDFMDGKPVTCAEVDGAELCTFCAQRRSSLFSLDSCPADALVVGLEFRDPKYRIPVAQKIFHQRNPAIVPLIAEDARLNHKATLRRIQQTFSVSHKMSLQARNQRRVTSANFQAAQNRTYALLERRCGLCVALQFLKGVDGDVDTQHTYMSCPHLAQFESNAAYTARQLKSAVQYSGKPAVCFYCHINSGVGDTLHAPWSNRGASKPDYSVKESMWVDHPLVYIVIPTLLVIRNDPELYEEAKEKLKLGRNAWETQADAGRWLGSAHVNEPETGEVSAGVLLLDFAYTSRITLDDM